MTVDDVVKKLNLRIFSGKPGIGKEVKGGYVSDLLSDVMGAATENQIWITLQSHKNVMAVASLKDLSAIILVRGFKPDADTMEESENEDIPVLGTDLSAFEIAGKLYNLLQNEQPGT